MGKIKSRKETGHITERGRRELQVGRNTTNAHSARATVRVSSLSWWMTET